MFGTLWTLPQRDMPSAELVGTEICKGAESKGLRQFRKWVQTAVLCLRLRRQVFPKLPERLHPLFCECFLKRTVLLGKKKKSAQFCKNTELKNGAKSTRKILLTISWFSSLSSMLIFLKPRSGDEFTYLKSYGGSLCPLG